MQNFRFGVSFAIFALSAIGYAGQADRPLTPETAAKTKVEEKTATPKQTAGAVTVFVDAATGKTRQPKPAEVEALTDGARTPATSQRSEDVNLLYGAHGAVGVKLGPESLNYVVFTKTSDGKGSTQCVTGADAAAEAVAGDASAAKNSK